MSSCEPARAEASALLWRSSAQCGDTVTSAVAAGHGGRVRARQEHTVVILETFACQRLAQLGQRGVLRDGAPSACLRGASSLAQCRICPRARCEHSGASRALGHGYALGANLLCGRFAPLVVAALLLVAHRTASAPSPPQREREAARVPRHRSRTPQPRAMALQLGAVRHGFRRTTRGPARAARHPANPSGSCQLRSAAANRYRGSVVES